MWERIRKVGHGTGKIPAALLAEIMAPGAVSPYEHNHQRLAECLKANDALTLALEDTVNALQAQPVDGFSSLDLTNDEAQAVCYYKAEVDSHKRKVAHYKAMYQKATAGCSEDNVGYHEMGKAGHCMEKMVYHTLELADSEIELNNLKVTAAYIKFRAAYIKTKVTCHQNRSAISKLQTKMRNHRRPSRLAKRDQDRESQALDVTSDNSE